MSAAGPAAGVNAAREIATDLKRRWRRGEHPDAAAALAAHPDLARYKSVVVDLAYEEYLLQEQAGSPPEPGPFADRFPAFRVSVLNTLGAHRRLLEQPELLDPPAGAWPEIGSRVEGIDLVAELGRGAFGRAYLAFDPGTDRLCVLKVAPGAAAEARVIGRLAHPHVTDIYWAKPAGHRTAVCMPFVGVSTLADVIAAAFPAGALPTTARVILEAAEADSLAGQADRRSAAVVRPAEAYVVGACAVGARIADAVAYLHREGVVHGDLKPSNVVIGPGGAPHLIDFNLATGDALPVSARGTPAYMAPEVLEAVLLGRVGGGGVVGVKADLFALGVVLFELLAGRHPFPCKEKATLTDLAKAVRRGPPAFPASVPQSVAAVVAGCLAPDPAARPATADVVAAALDRFVHRRRTARRRWWWRVIAVVGVVVVGVAAAIGVYAWPAQDAVAPPPHSPETAAEFFARGREFIRAEDMTAAQADFVAAHKRSGDPWALAFAAYSLARGGQPLAAAEMGRVAIQGGATSAEVHNNLGYALTEAARQKEAIGALDDALRITPGMQAALYNRALARYRLGLGGEEKKGADKRCAADITAALSAGPPSVELHSDAAIIYAACSAREGTLRAVALRQIRMAIAAGKDPTQCRNEHVFRTTFTDDPEFEAACKTPRGMPPEKSLHLRLVEPRLPAARGP
ncbi:MAG: pknH 1 [Gemmataceae bacterium]|nr:pknH 1 [Gemmataceae bacterium]